MIPLIAAGLAAAVIGGAVKAGTSASAANKKRAAEQAQQKELEAREKRLDDYYKQESGTNILDTSGVRSTLAMLRDKNKRATETFGNNAVRTGASDEAKVAMASKLNESYAQAASRIAGMGEDRRRQLEQIRFNGKNNIGAAKADLEYRSALDKAEAISGYGDIAGSTIGQIGGSISGLFGKGGVLSKDGILGKGGASTDISFGNYTPILNQHWSTKKFGEL